MKRSAMFILLLVIIGHVSAQRHPYVRVFDATGWQLAEGRVLSLSDTSLILSRKGRDSKTVLVKNIASIKTLRPAKHSITIGAAVGAVSLGITGAATGEQKVNDGTIGGALHDAFSYTPSEGFIGGLLSGAVLGGTAAGIARLIMRP